MFEEVDGNGGSGTSKSSHLIVIHHVENHDFTLVDAENQPPTQVQTCFMKSTPVKPAETEATVAMRVFL